MEEDAFDVMVQYANAGELAGMKDEYRKVERVDMCKGLADRLAPEPQGALGSYGKGSPVKKSASCPGVSSAAG